MPPQTRKMTIHGVIVQQTNLQGKWYTPVDARVKIAEQADPGMIRREDASYNVVSVQFIEIADRWAYHCLVEYPAGSGVVKPGTDFIDTKDPSGVAKAETSAIGRALGLHGIAIEESIASADEMSRVTAQQADTDATEEVAQPAPQSRQSAATRPPASTATPAQRRTPAPSHSDAGRPTAPRAAQGGVSAWVTTDGYDPTSDLDLKKRAHRIGVNNMADFEAILAYAREHYTPYDRVAVDAAMRVYEGRYEAAQEKVAKTTTQQQPQRQPQRQGA